VIDLTTYRPDIYNEVNGCSDIAIDRSVVEAVKTFCLDTWIWTDEILINVTAGTDEYSLASSDDTVIIHAIREVKDENNRSFAAYDYSRTSETITLDSVPTQDYTLKFTCVYIPKITATAIPDFFEEWRDAITLKAKQKLYMQPNTAWFNPGNAQAMEILYVPYKTRAKRLISKGYNTRPHMVSMPRFI